ncbi:MAG TPA: MFS transporter [Chloroflexi bacterium]|nr:MFS transporter [Chloroflexota bacterium]
MVGVQGGAIGKWSRRFGDIKLIYGGLALLAIGLAFAAFTPRQPPPWYSQTAIEEELNKQEDGRIQPNQIQLPPDDNKGWLGAGWLLLVLIPVAIGGSVLRPTINSVITKRVSPQEIGGILGVSTAFSSLANFVAPIMGGAIFQWAGATTLFLIWGGAIFILLLIARRNLEK